MELLHRFAECLDKKTIFIHIIGDSMLDEDYQVQVTRISPECPNVNILLSDHDNPLRVLPGGAANVCYQLNNFNVISRLFTFIDTKAYNIVKKYGINYWGKVHLPEGYFIPRKKRFYEKGFQVVDRWDIEKVNYGLDDIKLRCLQTDLSKYWSAFQAEPDVIIFSDYNKGLFAKDFKLDWYKTEAITIVDPKAAPLDRWKNCTVFKPNSKEAVALSGLYDWRAQCNFFQKELNCSAVVITQEGDGVVGKDQSDYFEYRPVHKIKPVDIIGAGDGFIAILGLAIAHGFNVREASQIAFHGGLMYVQQQQRGMLGPWSFHSSGKILKNCAFLKKRQYKLIFTNGCFDCGLTAGHIECLQYAKSLGDKLIVGVNSDESVKRLKGEARPLFKLADRMKIVAALECVDFVVPFKEDTPLEIIKEIRPQFVVKGGDYKPEDVAGFGIADIKICPKYDCVSTTDKIKAIMSQ